MKKYLIINDLGNGGAEILNIGLYHNLKFDAIFTLQQNVDYDTNGINVINLSRGGKVSILNFPKLIYRLYKHLQPNDVLIASLYKSIVVAFLCNLFLVKPNLIFWIHSDITIDLNSKFKKWLMKFIFNNKCSIVVNSEKAKLDVVKQLNTPENKINVIYNSFDANQIKLLGEEKLEDDLFDHIKAFPKMICIGRFNRLKGQLELIEVVADLKKKNFIIHLILIGKGESEQMLRDAANQLGVVDFVHFLGQKKNIYPYLKQCDLLVSASRSEGFGNVLVEGLLSGIPVISADIDNGPREILAPETNLIYRTTTEEYATYGILMPSFTNNAANKIWVDIIYEIFSNGRIKEYQNIGLTYANLFDKHHIMPKWEDLLKEK
ncbi:glycosyltransferase [Pedobacter sp. Hv1]|uniref:glycosyltransferase n=1 Tax=Pedobacter sp. Hv1 TaxID=1740090 RepID=UPI0006D88B8D|nr:glycosyltransferase [Pedobacter sp. Hv1]KQB99631.1 hypothetical protein AQF98_18955 [Pedobacter sp. Hv1]